MFQGLLKRRKFTRKCKSYIKLIKTRLDTIMRKKKAVQRFLKNDVAELLQNDLDIYAYGRVEVLLVEQNRVSCYEQIETFCNCVLEHLHSLQMQKECPDECKEAIHSLIYAAARFADLPELRSLRTLFTKKYGEYSDESCVNEEFVHKLRSRAFTKEMKLQVLHEIAQEHSLKWDSRPLEKKLYKPPSSRQETQKVNEQLENKEGKWGKSFASNRNEIAETAIGVESTSDDESSTDMSSQDAGKACSSSIASVSDDEAADNNKRPLHYRFIPPPYLKQNPISFRWRSLKAPPGHEDLLKSPEDESAKAKKTQNSRKEERKNFSSPRESGKPEAYAEAHQPQEAYDHGGENARRLKHPKLPEYDEVAARLAALRKN